MLAFMKILLDMFRFSDINHQMHNSTFSSDSPGRRVSMSHPNASFKQQCSGNGTNSKRSDVGP